MLPGAKESWDSLKVIFNPIDFKPVYFMSMKYNFSVIWPNDGKMQNFMLGLQSHSSFHPSPYSFYSQYTDHDESHISRTIESILDDDQHRRETGEIIHSVVSLPIQALIDHPDTNLLNVLPIAPLHNLTLIVNTFVGYLAKLDLDVASQFISDLPFTRDRHQGNELVGFPGRQCRIISKSMDKLRSRLPPLHILEKRLDLNSNSKQELNIDYTSPDYKFFSMWKLTDVVDNLTNLTYSVTRAILDPKWKEKWQHFSNSFEEFKETFLRIHPTKKGRHFISPKLHNILVHLVSYIENHEHSLHRCHEQAFETFHSRFKAFETKFKIAKVTSSKIIILSKLDQ
jgi:hypothetical protein